MMSNLEISPVRRARGWVLAIVVALIASACATNPRVDEGRRLIVEGRLEEGLTALEQAARTAPRTSGAHTVWVTQREAIVGGMLREAEALRTFGDLDRAEAVYRRALGIDPGNPFVQTGLDSLARDRKHRKMVEEAEEAMRRSEFARAERLVRDVLTENSAHRAARTVMRTVTERAAQTETAAPVLKAAITKPITLEFRDAPLRSVFEVISRNSGINFVFDRDVRADLRATIFVRNSSLDDVIRLLLVTNQLQQKVLNENSVLVYPNTPAKQREYQETVVRSFFLANADVKQTAAMIRALVKTRDLFIDEKLNLLVMKDTADAVRLAEQLVTTQDLGEPEVMLEVEVLEVASSYVQEFGFRYADRINFGVLDGGTGATPGVAVGTPPANIELKPRNWQFFVANPAAVLNLRQLDGTANLLANPRIRVKNRDKAKIHIGEKVPVITTTATANVGVASSVQYLEVGLKLDVEPNVYLEDEVAMKVQLEVSNILEQLNVQGTVSYRLGTRNTATTLRLKDGETQVLAGLINDDDRRAATKLPYIGDFPLLGRLFRSDNDQRGKTEIVLLITPRVVRNLARPDTVRAQFSSGTESAPGAGPMRLGATQPGSLSIAGSAAGAAAPGRAPLAALPGAGQQPPGGPVQAVQLSVVAPAQATIGQEFAVTLSLPARNEGANASVELIYDPAVLNAIGAPSAPVAGAAPAPGDAPRPPSDPGRVMVPVTAPAVAGAASAPSMVRFRIVAREAGSTVINFSAISATDASGREVAINAPGSHTLTIVPAGQR